MRKKIVVLLLLITITSLITLIIYNKTNHDNINYTSIGDGYAKGINSYGIEDYGYSDFFKDYLVNNHKLKDYSKEFTSTDMSIEKLYTLIVINKQGKKDNIRHLLRETNILTISLGYNDIITNIKFQDKISEEKINRIIQSIIKKYDLLIKEIKKYYVYDIYIIGYSYLSDDYYINYAIKKLNDYFQTNENIIYIKTSHLNLNKYLLKSKTIYPNTQGYSLIFKEILPKVEKKLEK